MNRWFCKSIEVLGEWKKKLAGFSIDEAKNGLGRGDLSAIHAYSGDAALIMSENPDIRFFVPDEGASLSSDDFVISAGSPYSDLAHAFINHMLDPDVAAVNMRGIHFYMPIPAALEKLPGEMLDNPAFGTPEAVMEKCEIVRDIGPEIVKYRDIWDEIMD